MFIGGGGDGGSFDVTPSVLTSVAAKVATDASHATAAVDNTASGADAAGAGCGGGPLATALGRFSAAVNDHGRKLFTAVADASTTLTANAETYTTLDSSVGDSFDAWEPLSGTFP